VPLRVSGKVIGIVEAINPREAPPQRERGKFNEHDLNVLQTLASAAAIALQNAYLFQETQTAAAQLQTLSRRLVETQEDERRRIARELHDEVGQLLTGLKLSLAMSASQPPGNLGEAQALVTELLTRVRDLSLNLRPAMLDDLGLLPALLWLFERYTGQTNVRVEFKHTGVEGLRFAPAIETAAYRIVQEALTNAARHAGVDTVTVHLWANGTVLGLQVKDEGRGFVPQAALAAGATAGLSGMRERAALLNGHLTIESAPGAGARLTAEFPLC
jgi:signal transduction histidine kinase